MGGREIKKQEAKAIIGAFMEQVIIDLNSKYQTTEKKSKWFFRDWRRGACWGIKRGEQIMRKRLRELI